MLIVRLTRACRRGRSKCMHQLRNLLGKPAGACAQLLSSRPDRQPRDRGARFRRSCPPARRENVDGTADLVREPVLQRGRLAEGPHGAWHCNELLSSGKPIGANSWARVQCGLSAMLISPSEKRRAAIEVRPVGPDADAVEAVAMVGGYQQKLQAVKSQ